MNNRKSIRLNGYDYSDSGLYFVTIDVQNKLKLFWGDIEINYRKVIQWFKTMTTNQYLKNIKNHNWPRFHKRLWQRNYFEHIIRDEFDLNRIRKYILENPLKWNKNN